MEKENKKKIGIGCAIVGVILVIVAVVIICVNNAEPSNPNLATNEAEEQNILTQNVILEGPQEETQMGIDEEGETQAGVEENVE